MARKPTKTIEQIIQEDGRYPLAAVQLVREGLNQAVEQSKPGASPSGRRHVSGAELCQAIRELALKRWGMLARFVLKRWNITATRDFGEIVFMLVDNGWMRKEPNDHIDDFNDAYDFHEAFDDYFEIDADAG